MGFLDRNAVRPGDSNLTGEQGSLKLIRQVSGATNPVIEQFTKLITFIAGIDVYLGLTCYDFLTTYGFLTATGGASLTGGVAVDTLTASGNVTLAATTVTLIGPDATEGSYRIFIDARGLVTEKYTGGEWKECQALNP